MKKCLFPIYAYGVSCAQQSKNLERYIVLVPLIYLIHKLFFYLETSLTSLHHFLVHIMHGTQLNNLSKKSSGVNGGAPYWAQFQSLLQRAWVVNNIHFGIDEYNSPLCLERYNDNKHTTIQTHWQISKDKTVPGALLLISWFGRCFWIVNLNFLVTFDLLRFMNCK